MFVGLAALLPGDGQVHDAPEVLPDPGGVRLGHLAGLADQPGEVVEGDGPTEGDDRRWCVLAGVFQPLRVGLVEAAVRANARLARERRDR